MIEPTLKFFDAQRVIAMCAADHAGGESRIIKVEAGHGIHVHSPECGYKEGDRLSCMKNCDDSDLIVTLAYKCVGTFSYADEDDPRTWTCCTVPGAEHHAVYGFLGERFSLWAD